MDTNRFDNHGAVLVTPLSHFRQRDLAVAGGKGANLGELSQAGFNVPPGYVITTTAYDRLLQTNNLQARLTEIIGSLDANDQDVVAKVSQQIQNALQEIPIPKQITDEIIKAFRRLNGGAVAVRSSATAEDLPEAAFAGQQETFLNVVGEGPRLCACWARFGQARHPFGHARGGQNSQARGDRSDDPADVAGVMFPQIGRGNAN
jgi:pyruvate,water dikinase